MYILKQKGVKTNPVAEFRNGAFSPSSLGQVYECSGYRILADTDDSPDHVITTQGKNIHTKAEKAIRLLLKKKIKTAHFLKFFKEGEPPEYDFVKEYVDDVVAFKRTKPSLMGTEVFLADTFYSDIVGGYVDFMGYHAKQKTLHVWDLKTGLKPTTESQKYQLYFYAIGAMNFLGVYDIVNVVARFYTRYGVIERNIALPELIGFKRHVAERIRRMEFNVGNHCKDCFHFKSCVPAHRRVKRLIQNTTANPETKEWGELYAFKPLVNKYFEFVEKAILDKHYKTGESKIGAFEIYETPGRKHWVKDKIPLILTMPHLRKKEIKPISVKKALDKGYEISNLWHLKKNKKVRLRKEVMRKIKLKQINK